MSDRTAEFFDALDHRGKEPLLEGATGTIRFDLEHDHGFDHWLVAIADGNVRVSREDREADAIVRTTKALFDRFAEGEEHIFAAWVRNEVLLLGDVRLGRLFERLLPGPPDAHHPREFARERRPQA
jgi:hypothetical protein